jgi:hypothetical protein
MSRMCKINVELITMYELYLTGQGLVSMESCTSHGSRFLPLSRAHDLLGWDYFIKGLIPILLITMVEKFLHEWSPRKLINKWSVSFIKSLLNITHKQWLYCNSDIHHRFDGLTSHQHRLLSERSHELIMTAPTDLLLCHHHLLEQDFCQLCSANTMAHQLWVTSMESAISVLHPTLH